MAVAPNSGLAHSKITITVLGRTSSTLETNMIGNSDLSRVNSPQPDHSIAFSIISSLKLNHFIHVSY